LAVQALKDGYEGMFVADAVGGRSQSAHRVAMERMAHAGAVANTALAVVTELFRDWGSLLADKARDVIYWYFAEVPKLGVNVDVSEAEKQAVKARAHAWMSKLSNKVCIITGTGRSVGRAAALAFAHEVALVVGCDVNVAAAEATAEMVRSQGRAKISLEPCSLTKPAECQALVDFAVRTYGRIDVLFNNAAMAYFNRLEDITDEESDRDLREEIDFVFFLTRAAWPHLKASHSVVVNIASLNGLLSSRTLGSLAHTTAKAGFIGMTRQLAMEGREHGIRANSVSPGLIETNQTREQLKDPEMGERDARQDFAWTLGSARGGGKRGGVSRIRREFLRHRRRCCGRWRHEGVVTKCAYPS
jgi:NAD(P)-dependent dehydrogenase (short-subunit alcohol dehydrogenase family)